MVQEYNPKAPGGGVTIMWGPVEALTIFPEEQQSSSEEEDEDVIEYNDGQVDGVDVTSADDSAEADQNESEHKQAKGSLLSFYDLFIFMIST